MCPEGGAGRGVPPTLTSDFPPPELRINLCEVPGPVGDSSPGNSSGGGLWPWGHEDPVVEGLPPTAVASALDPVLPSPKPARPGLSGGRPLTQDRGPDPHLPRGPGGSQLSPAEPPSVQSGPESLGLLKVVWQVKGPCGVVEGGAAPAEPV